jgi:NADPH-dependent 2,4-dienoyl-CoA reductase/sulfur reductase-like enzyme
VVLGLGTRPAVGLAESSGIQLGESGAIAVNPRMRTPHDGVWAAGDCVEARHLVSGGPVSYHLGTIANKQGRICGINIGGGYATFPGVLGTAASRVCDVEVARTGLSEAELGPLGLQWETATVDSTTRASYFPGTAPIRTKVLAERRSGRLLGAQIVGKEGAAKRIDVFATAIWNGMAVDEMVNLDLSYAPPFSPVWDPVLIAVRGLSEQVEKALRDSL